jgi:hypothetical protein
MSNSNVSLPELARTLVASGFAITNVQRFSSHAEIQCGRPDEFGLEIRYLIALSEAEELSEDTVAAIRQSARNQGLLPLVIGPLGSAVDCAWNEFLAALGGTVPSWRALSPDYESRLATLGQNRLPPDEKGEAWRLFEDAVADGFEFMLGKRVVRLGGSKRGRRVADTLISTPDRSVSVIDAKASSEPFGVDAASLRPLGEYVQNQVVRQQGHLEVGSAIIVADRFSQSTTALLAASNTFLADYRVPLLLLTTSELVRIVNAMRDDPSLRNSIRWRQILCRIGPIDMASFESEREMAAQQRMRR